MTGAAVDGATVDARYWGANLRSPVRFQAAVAAVAATEAGVWVELGPHPVLGPAIAASVAAQGRRARVVASLRRGEPERAQLLRAAAAIYEEGGPLHWPAIAPRGRVVALPTYPWQRQRYWIDAAPSRAVPRLLDAAALASSEEDRALIDHLLTRYPTEGSRAVNLPRLAPAVFLGSGGNACFYVRTSRRSIMTFVYVGADDAYRALVQELREFARVRGLHVNIIARAEQLPSLAPLPVTTTPLGVIHALTPLAGFTLGSRRMRRLRYLVNRYRGSGACVTREWIPRSEPAMGERIGEVMDAWSSTRKRAPAFLPALKERIRAGDIDSWHRLFVSERDGRLDACVVLSTVRHGSAYLMDLEFYTAKGAVGCVESTIVAIIETLHREGATSLSLGGTYGTRHDHHPNEDGQVATFLAGLHDRGILNGDGNVRFKRKFAPKETGLYLCRFDAADEEDLADVLLLLSDSTDQATGLSDDALRSLAEEHVVDGVSVVPGAAFLAMALEAAQVGDLDRPVMLRDVRFERPLTFDSADRSRGRASVRVDVDGDTFRVISGEVPDADKPREVSTHVRGRILHHRDGGPAAVTLEAARDRCRCELSPAILYARCHANGLEYGDRFRLVSRLWRGEHEAVAWITSTPRDPGNASTSALRIDAALQVMVAAIPDDRWLAGGARLMHCIEQVELERQLGPELWVFAAVHAPRHASFCEEIGDLVVFDPSGAVVMQMRSVVAASLAAGAGRAHYSLAWEPRAADLAAPRADHWLIVGGGGVAEEVATALRARGGMCRVVEEVEEATECAAMVQAWQQAGTGAHGVIHLGSLTTRDGVDVAALEASCGSAVRWVQGVVTSGSRSTRVWLVTRGGQAVGGTEPTQVAGRACGAGAGGGSRAPGGVGRVD